MLATLIQRSVLRGIRPRELPAPGSELEAWRARDFSGCRISARVATRAMMFRCERSRCAASVVAAMRWRFRRRRSRGSLASTLERIWCRVTLRKYSRICSSEAGSRQKHGLFSGQRPNAVRGVRSAAFSAVVRRRDEGSN